MQLYQILKELLNDSPPPELFRARSRQEDRRNGLLLQTFGALGGGAVLPPPPPCGVSVGERVRMEIHALINEKRGNS